MSEALHISHREERREKKARITFLLTNVGRTINGVSCGSDCIWLKKKIEIAHVLNFKWSKRVEWINDHKYVKESPNNNPAICKPSK